MKIHCFIFYAAISCVLCDISLQGIIPSLEEGETATDYPKGVQDGDPQFVQQQEETTDLIEGRQSDEVTEEENEVVVEASDNEVNVSSTTEHWSTQGCSGEHEYYNNCGPRCEQSCTFQPRVNGRLRRAICDSLFSGSCHPGKIFFKF